MGQFTNSVEVKRRKHRQRIAVPVIIDVADLEQIQEIVETGPVTLDGNVSDISASTGNATVVLSYTSRGANKTDVTRVLDKTDLRYITKRPTTERLCACESGDCEETED